MIMRMSPEEKMAKKMMRDAMVAERRAVKAMAMAEAKMAKAEAKRMAKMEKMEAKSMAKASRPMKGSQEMKDRMARIRAAKQT